jgi:hypothetical protein
MEKGDMAHGEERYGNGGGSLVRGEHEALRMGNMGMGDGGWECGEGEGDMGKGEGSLGDIGDGGYGDGGRE